MSKNIKLFYLYLLHDGYTIKRSGSKKSYFWVWQNKYFPLNVYTSASIREPGYNKWVSGILKQDKL